MNSIKQKLITNWHLMRIVRLAIGLWMLIIALQTRDWAMGLFGAFFLYQAITDTGCCGTQACSTPNRRHKGSAQEIKDIEYEELK